MTIKDLRRKKGITQAQLGEMLGKSQRTVSDYESCRKLSFRTAKRIADILGIDLNSLWQMLNNEQSA